jgi:hypothetical protein
MPLDFCGFSYESAQLADPTYFSGANRALVGQFRKLSNRGVLRLGGNLSDVTLWDGGKDSQAGSVLSPQAAKGITTRFEWKLVGRRAGEKRPATITPESIRALRSFLEATEWKLLYGLNLGSGTPERAAEEAACVAEHAGNSLLAFQVGNEADFFGRSFFRRSFRRHGWDFNRYWKEYQRYVEAVRARVPHAPFAGPDVAVNTDWVKRFAERAHGDAVLLTSHYYAMGPPEDPRMNAQRLLEGDRRVMREIPRLVAIGRKAGMPYRMTEGNSCFHGGKPGVSDAFASALWVANYLLFLAQAGCAGVNLHTGGEGVYAAFAGESGEIVERPVWFGMQFAQRFAGATFVENTFEARGKNVTAYTARRGREALMAILNQSGEAVEVNVTGVAGDAQRQKEDWALTAPGLDATTEVRWAQVESQDSLARLQVPAYSGRLVTV